MNPMAPAPPSSPAILEEGGQMGALMRAKDWSRTPLGSPDRWPQSLRTELGELKLVRASTAILTVGPVPSRFQ
jgi:hypothetical protein